MGQRKLGWVIAPILAKQSGNGLMRWQVFAGDYAAKLIEKVGRRTMFEFDSFFQIDADLKKRIHDGSQARSVHRKSGTHCYDSGILHCVARVFFRCARGVLFSEPVKG